VRGRGRRQVVSRGRGRKGKRSTQAGGEGEIGVRSEEVKRKRGALKVLLRGASLKPSRTAPFGASVLPPWERVWASTHTPPSKPLPPSQEDLAGQGSYGRTS
jgi:hypothetical protein